MLNLTDIKTGKNILWNEEPFKVLYHEHSKTGRAGAVLRTKLYNLRTGNVMEKTFQGSDKVDEADIQKTKAQYLYSQDEEYYFMDSESYEQFFLTETVLGEKTEFLIEGTEVDVLQFSNEPINVELPIKMSFKVTDAPPGLKGDTASGGDKVVTIETGKQITTPLFIKSGDTIIINTETGQYVSRG